MVDSISLYVFLAIIGFVLYAMKASRDERRRCQDWCEYFHREFLKANPGADIGGLACDCQPGRWSVGSCARPSPVGDKQEPDVNPYLTLTRDG